MPAIDDERVQPALEAVLVGDAAALEALLDRDPGLAAESWGENTLLEWTTQPPHDVADSVVELLIERSPSLDRALGLAGCWNLADMCRRLLAAGADPASQADAGITPLESAAMHSSSAAAAVLAAHGLHRPALWLAAAAGLIGEVESWVQPGPRLSKPAGPYRPNWVDVGRPSAPPAGNEDSVVIGEAFVFAALNGRLDTAQLLLDRGADIDARPYANTTALHFAIQFRRPEVVRFLLDRGAATDIIDDNHSAAALAWAAACVDDDDPAPRQIHDMLEREA